MKNKILKRILIITTCLTCINFLPTNIYAADDGMDVNGEINIMKKLDDGQINEINKSISNIGKEGGNVWNTYNTEAKNLDTEEQIPSGIMTRDTIMNYLVFLVQFLSQLGLFVGAGFIIYAGYKYMISVFNGGKLPNSTVKNSIIGILIIIFSYAIMKILTSFIGLT